MSEALAMARDDTPGHDDHGHTAPADDLWVLPPLLAGLVIAIVLAVVFGTGGNDLPYL